MIVKRVLIATIMFTALRFAALGQVVLVPEAPSGGMVIRQQLFSLLVNNFTGSARNGLLVIQVMDRNSSQVLLEATSNQIPLNAGAKRVTYTELSPLQISQAMPDFAVDKNLQLPLPIGDYLVCYKLFSADERREMLASECVKITAEALAPPQLVSPADGSSLTETRPVFTWTPPSPITMFSALQYDLVITPKYKGQSAAEAVQRNLPILSTAVNINSLPYPASFSNLETGKEYAWQIVARDGSRFGGKSEAWSFRLVPDSVKAIIETAAFIKLQEGSSEVSVLQQGMLKIDYVNRFADSTVRIVISDMSELGKPAISFILPVTRGQNLIVKEIKSVGRLSEGHVYQLRLINSNKEELGFRFIPKYYF